MRLTRALRDQIDEVAVRFRGCYCSPYHTNSALFPIIELLNRQCGILPKTPDRDRLTLLRAFMENADQEVDNRLPVLASLLSIPDTAGYTPPDLMPQQLREAALETILDMVRNGSKLAPMLFVFEDLHWIDPTTKEFLDRMIQDIPDKRVMVICTHRPGFDSRLGDVPPVTMIPLRRLNGKGSAEAIAKVAGKPVTPEVVQQIVEKSDCVPLYIEELTRMLIDGGHLIDRGEFFDSDGPLPPSAVPNSLQDSLMARLDSLSTVKEVALVAAVIERQFSYAMLETVADMPAHELQIGLRQLVDAQLLYQRGAMGDATYTFKQSLVQDATYKSILREKRQSIHRKITAALTEPFEAQGVLEPEVTAYHYEQAG